MFHCCRPQIMLSNVVFLQSSTRSHPSQLFFSPLTQLYCYTDGCPTASSTSLVKKRFFYRLISAGCVSKNPVTVSNGKSDRKKSDRNANETADKRLEKHILPSSGAIHTESTSQSAHIFLNQPITTD